MFVYGDVVIFKIGRYWPWKTVTVSSHLHMPVRPTLLHRMALVSFLLFRKNLGNLREFFGQMVYRPPGKKIARTPMQNMTSCALHYDIIYHPLPINSQYLKTCGVDRPGVVSCQLMVSLLFNQFSYCMIWRMQVDVSNQIDHLCLHTRIVQI